MEVTCLKSVIGVDGTDTRKLQDLRQFAIVLASHYRDVRDIRDARGWLFGMNAPQLSGAIDVPSPGLVASHTTWVLLRKWPQT